MNNTPEKADGKKLTGEELEEARKSLESLYTTKPIIRDSAWVSNYGRSLLGHIAVLDGEVEHQKEITEVWEIEYRIKSNEATNQKALVEAKEQEVKAEESIKLIALSENENLRIRLKEQTGEIERLKGKNKELRADWSSENGENEQLRASRDEHCERIVVLKEKVKVLIDKLLDKSDLLLQAKKSGYEDGKAEHQAALDRMREAVNPFLNCLEDIMTGTHNYDSSILHNLDIRNFKALKQACTEGSVRTWDRALSAEEIKARCEELEKQTCTEGEKLTCIGCENLRVDSSGGSCSYGYSNILPRGSLLKDLSRPQRCIDEGCYHGTGEVGDG